MAIALYVTSTETYSGKTALAVGMAQRMRRDGLKVGYFKPLSFSATHDEKGPVDEDSRVIKRLLGTEGAAWIVLCPVMITPSVLDRILRGETPDYADRIQICLRARLPPTRMSSSSRAPTTWRPAALSTCRASRSSRAFQAKCVVVVRYRG